MASPSWKDLSYKERDTAKLRLFILFLLNLSKNWFKIFLMDNLLSINLSISSLFPKYPKEWWTPSQTTLIFLKESKPSNKSILDSAFTAIIRLSSATTKKIPFNSPWKKVVTLLSQPSTNFQVFWLLFQLSTLWRFTIKNLIQPILLKGLQQVSSKK